MKKYLFPLSLMVLMVSVLFWKSFVIEKGVNTQISNIALSDRIIPKVIKYQMEISNPSNTVIDKPSILVAIPTKVARHSISKVSVSEPYKMIEDDETGNVSLEITLVSLVPYEIRLIDIIVNLDVHSKPLKVSVDNIDYFTKSEKFIESGNERIMKQAKLLNARSKVEQAKKTYDWVTSYLSDSGFIQEDRGALYALNTKTADCTGYMYLYGALLRANKIPARMVSGFIVESNKKLKIQDYHNWVEVYLDGTWRVVDPQNNKFLENESDYIAMRIIDNSKKSKYDNSQQLFKTQGAFKISMK